MSALCFVLPPRVRKSKVRWVDALRLDDRGVGDPVRDVGLLQRG